MNKNSIRLDQYVNELLDKRRDEIRKKDVENELNIKHGKGMSSPAGDCPPEELKTLKEYIHSVNLMHLGKALPDQKKDLMLRKFFKHKRNQLVEVYSTTGQQVQYIRARVNAVGRDFVILTTLTDRFWIPYSHIETANMPFGIPDVSNTHQHLVFDKELRKKLLTQFSAIVAKKDVLIQQLFEESLQTNLNKWKGIKVKIDCGYEKITGKIVESNDRILILKSGRKFRHIPIDEISFIKSVRYKRITNWFKKLKHWR